MSRQTAAERRRTELDYMHELVGMRAFAMIAGIADKAAARTNEKKNYVAVCKLLVAVAQIADREESISMEDRYAVVLKALHTLEDVM